MGKQQSENDRQSGQQQQQQQQHQHQGQAVLSASQQPLQQQYHTPSAAATSWFTAPRVLDSGLALIPADQLHERQRARMQFGERLLASMGRPSEVQRVDCTHLSLLAASSLPPLAEGGDEGASKLGYTLRVDNASSVVRGQLIIRSDRLERSS